MTAKAFRISTVFIAAASGGLLAWAIVAETAMWIPVAGILLAMAAKTLIRKRTTEKLSDERNILLGRKAISISYRISVIGMVVTALGFILFRASLPVEYETISMTLAFSACMMMILQMVFYYFYSKGS